MVDSPPRAQLRRALASGEPVFAPLCLEPLVARITHELGFGAGYLSGGALGYSLAVSEALLSLTEVATLTRQITARSALPLVVDGGVGFGDPVHAARAMWELEAAGAAAVELEDQVAPKRVSHHRGIEHLVSTDEMVAKLRVAVDARRDPDFLVIARTGAVRNESFEAAIARGRAYREAGADLIMLFPADDEQWKRAPALIDAPLATIAALDQHTPAQWRELGWSLVIDAFTAQVLAVRAVRDAYARFAAEGRTGHDLGGGAFMDTYRKLADWAGLAELYDIERATTEPGT